MGRSVEDIDKLLTVMVSRRRYTVGQLAAAETAEARIQHGSTIEEQNKIITGLLDERTVATTVIPDDLAGVSERPTVG